MKKLLLFVAAFLIMALPTVAQETDLSEEEFKQKIDSVFEHVDMTSVETGILIEHGFNLLDPNVFNGQKPDSVYSNKEIMKALYDIGFDGPIRPDHGRMIWGEIAMPGYGLYDRALGATYLNGLWEAIEKGNKK